MIRKGLPLLLLVAGGCLYTPHRHESPPGRTDPPLSRTEAEQLASAGISDAVILEVVDRRGAAPLSADDLVALKKAGASEAVMDRMIANERQEPPVATWDAPVIYHRSYYYPGYYYPHVGFGFSYGFGGYRCRRGGWGVSFGW